MHCSIERKFNLGNYQTKTVTVGISQVPLHATDAMVADMLKTSATVVEALDRQIEHDFNPRNPQALDEAPALEEKIRSEEPVSTVKITEGSEALRSADPPKREIIASGKADPWEDAEVKRIPHESDVTLPTIHVLGIDVMAPQAEWLVEPIEELDPAGGQGKQMKHLNTALTSAGFKDGDRHWASLAIIKAAYGGIARTSLTSLKQLTRGEAHVVTAWLMEAGEAELSALRKATSALKGQLVMGDGRPEGCCDEFPFCDHNWAKRKEFANV